MREEGWKDLNDSIGKETKGQFLQNNATEMYEHKYNVYGDVDRYYEGYWDTKLNHIYYN